MAVILIADDNVLLYDGYDLCDYETNIMCYRIVLYWQFSLLLLQGLPTAFAFDFIFVTCVTYVFAGSQQLATAFQQYFLLIQPENDELMKLRKNNLKEIIDQHNMIMK